MQRSQFDPDKIWKLMTYHTLFITNHHSVQLSKTVPVFGPPSISGDSCRIHHRNNMYLYHKTM